MRERTSERWTSSLALFPSASVHSYPSSKWCCPCTHEFLVVGFITFLFDPLHHTCVVSVVKWVCSGGGCPLNRQEPRLQVELPVAAGETRPLNPRSAVWNPHVTLCCAVVLTPKQLASFPAEASTTRSQTARPVWGSPLCSQVHSLACIWVPADSKGTNTSEIFLWPLFQDLLGA